MYVVCIAGCWVESEKEKMVGRRKFKEVEILGSSFGIYGIYL